MCARKKVWFLLCKYSKFSAPYQSSGKAFPPQMFCFLHSHCFRVASECRKRAEHARFAVMDSLYVNFAWCVHKKRMEGTRKVHICSIIRRKSMFFASLSHKLLISQPNCEWTGRENAEWKKMSCNTMSSFLLNVLLFVSGVFHATSSRTLFLFPRKYQTKRKLLFEKLSSRHR